MNLILIVLIIGVFLSIKFSGFQLNFQDSFELRYSNCIKGICCLLIIITHICQNLNYNGNANFISKTGYLWVSLFFFYSGYGVMYNYLNKKKYMETFIKKRFLSIIIPVILSNIIYLSFNYYNGLKYSIFEFIYYIIRFDLIVKFSWYVIVILIFYTFFYVSFKFFNNKKALILISILSIIYIIIGSSTNIPDIWYKSSIAFLLGILFVYYKERITIYFNNKYWIKLFFSTIIITSLTIIIYSNKLINIQIKGILTSVMLIIMYVIISFKFKFYNKVFSAIGKVSYELYLIHGLILTLLNQNIIIVNNELLYTTMVFFISYLISIILNMISKIILIKIFNKNHMIKDKLIKKV